MKRFYIASLCAIVLSVLLVAGIEYDPGYILISYGLYTIESTVWVGLGVALVFFPLAYGFFGLLRKTIAGGSTITGWITGRSSQRNQKQTTQGLIAFIEGNWESSRRTLERAAANSTTPVINYLIAARASHALGDSKKVQEFLTKAEASASGASIAVDLTQADLLLQSGSFEQSLAILNRVRGNAGKHPHVLLLLKEAYQGLNDWQELLRLVPELKKYKVLSADQLIELELTASKNSIIETAKLCKDGAAEIHKLWKMLPKQATKNSELVAVYAQSIMAQGEVQTAEKLIHDRLKKDWNKKLVDLYGRVEGVDIGKQLLFAERWLKEHSNDATLLLCLGRLSLRNSLWGKAREYFEISLRLEESSEVCAELGRLLGRLGEHKKSNEYFQRGLLLTTHGLPQLPLPSKH